MATLVGRKPWFRISGKPGREKVGYLEEISGAGRQRLEARKVLKSSPAPGYANTSNTTTARCASKTT